MFSEDYRSRFAGVARLYGVPALEKLARSRVCLVGLGGVGSWTCEALARSGVGALTLIDADDVCATNANRQLHALDGNFGRAKADALAERVRAINPECAVSIQKIFVDRENAPAFFEERRGAFDLVVDAIDGARNKAALIAACAAAGTPVVSSGGCAGNATAGGRNAGISPMPKATRCWASCGGNCVRASGFRRETPGEKSACASFFRGNVRSRRRIPRRRTPRSRR